MSSVILIKLPMLRSPCSDVIIEKCSLANSTLSRRFMANCSRIFSNFTCYALRLIESSDMFRCLTSSSTSETIMVGWCSIGFTPLRWLDDVLPALRLIFESGDSGCKKLGLFSRPSIQGLSCNDSKSTRDSFKSIFAKTEFF